MYTICCVFVFDLCVGGWRGVPLSFWWANTPQTLLKRIFCADDTLSDVAPADDRCLRPSRGLYMSGRLVESCCCDCGRLHFSSDAGTHNCGVKKAFQMWTKDFQPVESVETWKAFSYCFVVSWYGSLVRVTNKTRKTIWDFDLFNNVSSCQHIVLMLNIIF